MDEVERMFEWLSNTCFYRSCGYVDEVVKVFPTKQYYNLRLLICKLLKNAVQIRIQGLTSFHKLGKIAIKNNMQNHNQNGYPTVTYGSRSSSSWVYMVHIHKSVKSRGILIAEGFRVKEEGLMWQFIICLMGIHRSRSIYNRGHVFWFWNFWFKWL